MTYFCCNAAVTLLTSDFVVGMIASSLQQLLSTGNCDDGVQRSLFLTKSFQYSENFPFACGNIFYSLEKMYNPLCGSMMLLLPQIQESYLIYHQHNNKCNRKILVSHLLQSAHENTSLLLTEVCNCKMMFPSY